MMFKVKKTYQYFVAYTYNSKDKTSISNWQFGFTKRLTTNADLEVIRKHLCDVHQVNHVTFLTYPKLMRVDRKLRRR